MSITSSVDTSPDACIPKFITTRSLSKRTSDPRRITLKFTGTEERASTSSRTPQRSPVQRFVHGHLNHRTTHHPYPPPITNCKIPQPRRDSKHFQATDRTSKSRRHNVIDRMGSSAAWVFDSMTISTHDVGRIKQLSSESRRSSETYHGERQ